jgi:hypothetical protein
METDGDGDAADGLRLSLEPSAPGICSSEAGLSIEGVANGLRCAIFWRLSLTRVMVSQFASVAWRMFVFLDAPPPNGLL